MSGLTDPMVASHGRKRAQPIALGRALGVEHEAQRLHLRPAAAAPPTGFAQRTGFQLGDEVHARE